MEPGNRRPARIALLKAVGAALGAALFLLAITLPAPWAYAAGALLVAASVVLGHGPRHR
ncbi:hypothetical protein [Kitasatospora purpeofusca]|uniref:hypothetical protein n=1 Tax=Kitasatospora purpeofusca TaxID=67352 RepID=UPI003F4ADBA5